MGRRPRLVDPRIRALPAGAVIHGFAAGSFGRDSYDCRKVEQTGADWIVTRDSRGEAEFCQADRVPSLDEADNRSWCSPGCAGPEMEGES